MDFRRLLLALSLSFIFIFVWQTIFMPPQTKDVAVTNSDTPVKTDIADVETPPQNSRSHLNALENKVDIKEVFNIKTNLLSVDLANNGTSISNLSIIESDPTNQNRLKHVGSWDKNSGLYNVDAVEIMKLRNAIHAF